MTARKRRARIVRLDPGVTRGRAPVMPLGASPFLLRCAAPFGTYLAPIYGGIPRLSAGISGFA